MMKSQNRNYSLQQSVASATTTKSSVIRALLFLLIFYSPPTVFPFKTGHVESLPGSAVARRGPAANSSSSRHHILQKLAGPRREIMAHTGYDTSSAMMTDYYGQSQSASQEQHTPFVRFPAINSPFNSRDPPSPGVVTKSSEKRHRNRQKIHKQHKVSTEPSAPADLHEDPSSVFGSSREELDSTMYYMTGSDAKISSIDADRYSQETDLYEKQTETSIKSLVADASHSSSSPAPPSFSATSSASVVASSKNTNSNNNLRNNNINSDKDASLTKPNLLPPHYLSLATFRHIDGTLEKSSGSIIGRIANFWRNMGNNNHTATLINTNANDASSSKESNGSSNRSTNSNYLKNNTSSGSSSGTNAKRSRGNIYTRLASDSSSTDLDENDVSLIRNNHHDNDNNGNNSHQKTSPQPLLTSNKNRMRSESSRVSSSSSLQPSKFISIEDTSGRNIVNSKQQYFSLDEDGEDDVVIGSNSANIADDGHAKGYHNHNDHLDQHFQSSIEDYLASDGSAGDIDNLNSDSHSFHEDLFHNSGTITGIISNDPHQDLMGSGTTNSKSILKSGPTAASSGVITRGDVKRAQSDKIWSLDSHFSRNDLIESAEEEEHDDYYYGMTIGGFLKRELWTIPLFVLAALNMILIILFEVYVLCRARGQSRRHLFLGQMLLFGLFLCSFLALMFAVHPSIIGCFVGRLGVGITYSLIFSVLMVKCVFLLSLDTGIYLPTSYQGILLFFAVLVQVAIDTQWVIMYPPFLQTVESGRSILLQCGTSFVQLLYSLSYIGFLVLMVGFLAGRAAYKGVVENYRESVYILITAVVTVPVALSWTVAGWMLQGRHQDACVSFGLVAHSLTTFLIMFMPKGRQLASLDKEAVCFEDQEDQCSGYSPSFFHFKPTTKNYKTTLWGDGNLYTTLEPTVSTINPNVFFHRNDFHSGMIY